MEIARIHSKIRKRVKSFLNVLAHESGIRLFWIHLSSFIDKRNVFYMKQNVTQLMSMSDKRKSSICNITLYGIGIASMGVFMGKLYFRLIYARMLKTLN